MVAEVRQQYEIDPKDLNFEQLFCYIESLEEMARSFTIKAHEAKRVMEGRLLQNGTMRQSGKDEAGEFNVWMEPNGDYDRTLWAPLHEILSEDEKEKAWKKESERTTITPARWDLTQVKKIAKDREKVGLTKVQELLDSSWMWKDPTLNMERIAPETTGEATE